MEKGDFLKVKMLYFNARCVVIKDGKPMEHPLKLGKWYRIMNSVKSHTEAYYRVKDQNGDFWIVKVDLRGDCND